MDYYKDEKNVAQYKEMLEGYDNSMLIEKLKDYLPAGSTLLELGMGVGLDLDELSKQYEVTGSDSSPIFVNEYKKRNTRARVLILDAAHIDIHETFDCIYSNKVMQHLTLEAFKKSLLEQKAHLNAQGILFMTLWYGTYQEEWLLDGQILFTYYTEEDIKRIVGDDFDIEKLERYTESDEGDSMLVVLRKK